MALLSSLTLENFRTFRKRTTFDLAPLTLVTGPNSSGKSSLLKALLFLRQNARLGQLHEPTFAGGEHDLGSLANVRSRGSDREPVGFAIGFDWGEEDEWDYNYPALDPSFPEWSDGELRGLIGHVHFELEYEERRDHVALRRFSIATGRHGEHLLFEVDVEPDEQWTLPDVEAPVLGHGYRYRATLHAEWFFPSAQDAWDGLGFPYRDSYERFGSFEEFVSSLSSPEREENPERDEAGMAAIVLSRPLQFTFSDWATDGQSPRPLTLERLIDRACDARKWDSMDGKSLIAPAENAFVPRALDVLARPYLKRWLDYLQSNLSEIDHAAPLRGRALRLIADDDPQARLLRVISTSPKNVSLNPFVSVGPGELLGDYLRLFEVADGYTVERVADVGLAFKLTRDGETFSLADLGYGFAQILPLLLYASAEERVFGTLLSEEPEANLHPNLQARLAELFLRLAEPLGAHVLVETHSEYLIRRLQYLVAKKEADPERIAIYYLGTDPEAEDYVRRITISPRGRLSEEFGPGFFDEATNLMVALYKYGSEN